MESAKMRRRQLHGRMDIACIISMMLHSKTASISSRMKARCSLPNSTQRTWMVNIPSKMLKCVSLKVQLSQMTGRQRFIVDTTMAASQQKRR